MEITELKTTHEYQEAYPLMHELRTNLDEEEFYSLLQDMIPQGYRLFVIRANDQIVSLAGVAIQTNLYYKKHLWVYDLVTKDEFRSKNYGKKLLRYLEDFAKENQCQSIALSSGLKRELAHEFYERAEYEKVSYVFKKPL